MGSLLLLLSAPGFSSDARLEGWGSHSASLTSSFKVVSIPLPFLLLPGPFTAGLPAGWILPISAVLRGFGAPGLCQPLSAHAHSMPVNTPLSPLVRKPPPGVSQDTVLPCLGSCLARSHKGLPFWKKWKESENRKANQENPTVVLRHGDKIQTGLSTGVVLGVVWRQDHSIGTNILSTTGS